jgi:hypothetical protein
VKKKEKKLDRFLAQLSLSPLPFGRRFEIDKMVAYTLLDYFMKQIMDLFL